MSLERRDIGEASNPRDAILDATESIMVEEGYAAVTSRRVGERAGLKSKLVHYYFGTMDELFVAVYERVEREFLRRHVQAATSSQPLRTLWELSIHPQQTRLSQELIALSNHKKSIQKITARVLEQIHAINTAFITKYLEEAEIDLEKYPPVLISYIINSVSRGLVMNEALGVAADRGVVLAFAERMLTEIEVQHRVATARRAALAASA